MLKKGVVPETGKPQSKENKRLGSGCGNKSPIERKRLSSALPAPRIAALYVASNGSYANLPNVDAWDVKRDARKYSGPWPVIAHPPCQRWGKFWAGQPLAISKTGIRKVKGDDEGCFASALDAVRRFGGVIEHPWGSHAWPHFGLSIPPRNGGWIKADDVGWTCCVEQGRYGHYARKPTMLYAIGVRLIELDWGKSDPVFPDWAISRYGIAKCKRAGELAFRGGGVDSSSRIGTPVEFRDLLISMVESALPAPWTPCQFLGYSRGCV